MADRFEDLQVWKKAKDLSVAVYRITGSGAFAKDFGLRDQIRRAAVSVMSNIAEGFERYSIPDFQRFLSIARGSASEVRSQLHLLVSFSMSERVSFKISTLRAPKSAACSPRCVQLREHAEFWPRQNRAH